MSMYGEVGARGGAWAGLGAGSWYGGARRGNVYGDAAMSPVSGVTRGSGGYTYQKLRTADGRNVYMIVAGPGGAINKQATDQQAAAISADIQRTRGKWNAVGTNDKPGTSTAAAPSSAAPSTSTKGSRALQLAALAAGASGSGEGQAVSSIIDGFQKGGKGAGLNAAAIAAGKFGPGMVEAAKDFVAARKDNPKRLERKLAHAKTKYAKASAAHNKKHMAKWRHKIEMFSQMLARLRAANADSMADTSGAIAGMQDDVLPSWALPVGIAAAIGLVVVMASKKAA